MEEVEIKIKVRDLMTLSNFVHDALDEYYPNWLRDTPKELQQKEGKFKSILHDINLQTIDRDVELKKYYNEVGEILRRNSKR